jgi:threonine/homoserine/homoserine lactone efflux protein
LLPDAATLAVFATASLALYVAPGPDMYYTASASRGQGRRAGMLSALGTTTGLVIHTMLAAFGLSALLALFPPAFQVIRWLGVAYLLYLGLRVLLSGEAPGAPAGQAVGRSWWIYGQGVLVNLLNPKIALFFLAFLPQFVDPARGAPAAQMVVLGGLFDAGGLLWTLFLALLFGGAGDWLARHAGVWKWQRRFTATALIGLAAYLAASNPR